MKENKTSQPAGEKAKKGEAFRFIEKSIKNDYGRSWDSKSLGEQVVIIYTFMNDLYNTLIKMKKLREI
jgi:hypothetical protein